MQDQLKELTVELETALAIETLEYHDINHLSGDPKTRSKERQRQLKRCLYLTAEIQRVVSQITGPTKGNDTILSGTPDHVAGQLLQHGGDIDGGRIRRG